MLRLADQDIDEDNSDIRIVRDRATVLVEEVNRLMSTNPSMYVDFAIAKAKQIVRERVVCMIRGANDS